MSIQTFPHRTSLSSLSSVLLGAGIAAAIALTFTSLSLALGFGAIDAYSNNPLAGVGSAVGIPSVIGLVLGLAVGAYVAGHLSGACGYAHGLATWALVLILGAYVSTGLVGGAVSTTGSVAGSVLSSVGSAAGGLAQGAGSAVGGGLGTLNSDLLGNIDWKQKSQEIKSTLRNTQIEALQPEQLEKTFSAATQDIKDAVRSIAIEPSKAGDVLTALGTKLTDRVKEKTANFNRDDAVNALVNNGMERADAEKAIDNAQKLMDETRQTVEQGVERTKQTIAQLQQASQDLEKQARDAANEAASAASTASWWSFIAAVLGALIAAYAGHAGVRSREKYPHTVHSAQ